MAHFLSPLLREPGAGWRLVNQTRETTVATHVETAFDSDSRRRGLLGRQGIPAGHALVIAPSNAVHSFFMRFPIDVIFANREGTVLKVTSPLAVWRLSAAWGGFAVIELSAGAAGSTLTLAGDRLAVVGAA